MLLDNDTADVIEKLSVSLMFVLGRDYRTVEAPRQRNSPNFEVRRMALYPALWLEEAELLPVRPVLEQDGRVIEARLVADNICRNHLPGVTVEILPLVFIVCTDAEACLEHITVVTAGFE